MSTPGVTALPDLRRLPVPVAEPRAALRVVREHPRAEVDQPQGVLPLDGLDPPDPGTTTSPRTAPSPTTPESGAPEPSAPESSAGASVVEAPTAGTPTTVGWTRQFVQAALEVGAGRRPASQLVRWTSEEVFATLARRSALTRRRALGGRDSTFGGRNGRTPTGSVPGTDCGAPTVRSVRLCQPRTGVLEACVVVADRGRARAVALRLEGCDRRWRVTALEIG